MKPIKIKLGPVTLSFAIGDADKNGCLDVSVGLRVVGFFEINPPPINLTPELAQAAANAAKQLADRFAKKK